MSLEWYMGFRVQGSPVRPTSLRAALIRLHFTGTLVAIFEILTLILSELWNLWEDVFQCLQTAAPHDQPRGERGAQEVQVLRLWKSIQIQASFEGISFKLL